MFSAIVACACAAGGGCRPLHARKRAHEVAPPEATEPVALLGGCRATRAGGECEVDAGDTLTVWAEGAGEVTFSHEGHGVVVDASVPVGGGTRYSVRAPAVPGELRVRTRRGLAAWRLAARTPAPAEIARARALRASGDSSQAKALAETLTHDRDALTRSLALKILGNVAFAEGDEMGVDARFAAAIDAAEEAGVISEAANDAASWTFMLIERAQLGKARAAIERTRRYAGGLPEARASLAFYEGRMAATTGSLRVALSRYREAEALSDQLDLGSLRHGAREEIAFTLRSLGRAREALGDFIALNDEVVRLGSPACIRANGAQNIAETTLEVPDAPVEDARRWLAKAIALYEGECKTGERELGIALGVQARADLADGDVAAAALHLAQARRHAPHPAVETALDWLDVEGRVALARGDLTGAARAYDDLVGRARSIGDRAREGLALERRAEVFARRGDRAAAARALDEAGDRVDSEAGDVPLGEGRDVYVAAHERADRQAVELLLALGTPARALERLRRARARAIASLVERSHLDAAPAERRARWETAVGEYRDAREKIDAEAEDDWRFSAATLEARLRGRTARSITARRALEAALSDVLQRGEARALPALPQGDGEVTLAIEPGATWIVFAATRGQVRAVDVGSIDPHAPADALARALFSPVHDELASAHRVSVLALGVARALDVHALPFEGAPLGTRAAVVYAMDAGGTDAGPGARGGGALVVTDPSGDLPSARAEATLVASALARAALGTRTLSGADATGSAVRAALASVELFHYAGHGTFAGRDGWESALPLAEHARLEVADVLALGRVPPRVVLLGCDTARDSDRASAEGVGLAQAFVLAGAHAVVAATRTVGDDAARAMAAALYAAMPPGGDLVEATRGAYRALAGGPTDWAAFRVIVP